MELITNQLVRDHIITTDHDWFLGEAEEEMVAILLTNIKSRLEADKNKASKCFESLCRGVEQIGEEGESLIKEIQDYLKGSVQHKLLFLGHSFQAHAFFIEPMFLSTYKLPFFHFGRGPKTKARWL